MTALDYAEVEFDYRGTTFRLVEVDTATYDDCLEKSTSEDYETGVRLENIDEQMLIRLLLVRALVEPKWTATDISKAGVRLTKQLERDVRTLHLGLEPVSRPKTVKTKRGKVIQIEPAEEEDDDSGKADA